MYWLPPVEHEDRRWHLPLSEGAAAYLLYRRLVGNTVSRGPWSRKKLSRLLLCDPAFCLWCLWHQQQEQQVTQPPTFRALAKWLSRTPLRTWLPEERESADFPGRDRATPNRLCKLATRAVSAVVRSEGNRWARRPSALARQLHNAEQWFVPRHADLEALPIPVGIRRQIAARRSRADAGRARRARWRARHARWVGRTWAQPMISCRDALAAVGSVAQPVADTVRSPDTVKLEALQQLAYGASHEINNPLANITTRAQLLMRLTDDATMSKQLSAINQQAFRAHEMIADLMLFAKPPQLQYTIFDLADLVREVVAQSHREMEERDQHVQIRERLCSAMVQADAAQLAVALRAIFRNAAEALQDEGNIWVRLRSCAGRREPGRLQLRIRDNGPGLSVEARQHLFDPFYSGREFGRGLGFGLTKAWTILRLHRGDVSVRSPATGGVEFVIRLPCD